MGGKLSKGELRKHMRLFVGGISYSTQSDELQKYFETFGTVTEVKLIHDRETNLPKGFGFVEMPEADEAKAAIAELHGKEFGGRNLTVNEAKPVPRQAHGRVNGHRGQGRDRRGARE